ncbi:Chaperone protein dnaJ 11 [Abeliophyllum distichum]|uniref:Chaperone protein dnaJ 11 n=1 Tax=Abeliophyllum distichum TaxID=126358 RepID=A0ABD1QZL7_9LAMI
MFSMDAFFHLYIPKLTFIIAYIPSPPLLQNNTRFTYYASASAQSSIRSQQPHIVASTMTATLLPRSSTSFYQVLGILMGASSQEIKAAYRKLARIFHLDVASVDKKDTSVDEFMRIHTAYSTLSDAEKRTDYDLRIFRLHCISSLYSVEYVWTSRFSSGYTNRHSWETDKC